MTTPPTPQPQPAPLPERVQAALAVKACPPVYVDIVNPSGRVSYRRWSDHPDVQEALGTQGYSVRRSDSQYELEGEPHPLRALLAETAAALAAAEAERDALRAAGRELLTLKDGPRDAAYHELKPFAWKRLRAALGGQS